MRRNGIHLGSEILPSHTNSKSIVCPQNRTLEAEGHIECLESKVGQLESVRVKQAEKISKLRTDVVSKSEDLNCNLQSANQTVQALTRELQTTKLGMDECSKREKQVM